MVPFFVRLDPLIRPRCGHLLPMGEGRRALRPLKKKAPAPPNGRSCQRMLTEEGIGSFMNRHQQWCLFLCVSIPSSARAAGTFSQWEKGVRSL